jgi:type VI secretion system protein VasG
MSVDLQALFGKLNQPIRTILEGAVALCQSRTHYDIEVEHYLMKLLDHTEVDAAFIF